MLSSVNERASVDIADKHFLMKLGKQRIPNAIANREGYPITDRGSPAAFHFIEAGAA
jgi:hypothetical protein